MSSSSFGFEYSFYIGNYLSGILYGVQLTIYGMIVYHTIFQKGKQSSPKSRWFCAIYSTVMIMLSTISISSNAIWGEEMWITHRNDLGGVPRFIGTTQITYQIPASSAVIICIFLVDALLLYRLFVLYGRSYVVLAFPTLTYLATIGLAIAQLIFQSRPNGNFFAGPAANVSTAFYVLAVCLNIILTGLFCGRLLRILKQASSSIGKESPKAYSIAAAIFVESAALYSIFGFMYLVTYAMRVPIARLFAQLWTKMSVIAPLLIILRIVRGQTWTTDINVTSRTPPAFAKHTSFGAGSTTLAEARPQTSSENP